MIVTITTNNYPSTSIIYYFKINPPPPRYDLVSQLQVMYVVVSLIGFNNINIIFNKQHKIIGLFY